MADAVYDASIANSQSNADSKADVDANLERLRRDLDLARAAAATFAERGLALIDQVSANRAKAAAAEKALELACDSRKDAFYRLEELLNCIRCAWLAAGNITDSSDCEPLQAVLENAENGMRALLKDLASSSAISA